YSRLGAGKLEIEQGELSARDVVDHVGELLAEKAQSKGLELITVTSASVPDCLMGDGMRLRQVLLNLTGNAVKFTDRGQVVVRCVWIPGAEESAGRLRFEFHDTG